MCSLEQQMKPGTCRSPRIAPSSGTGTSPGLQWDHFCACTWPLRMSVMGPRAAVLQVWYGSPDNSGGSLLTLIITTVHTARSIDDQSEAGKKALRVMFIFFFCKWSIPFFFFLTSGPLNWNGRQDSDSNPVFPTHSYLKESLNNGTLYW